MRFAGPTHIRCRESCALRALAEFLERFSKRPEDTFPLRALTDGRRQPIVPRLPVAFFWLEYLLARCRLYRRGEPLDALSNLLNRRELEGEPRNPDEVRDLETMHTRTWNRGTVVKVVDVSAGI